MARVAVSDWDVSQSNNSDINGINIAEGCPAAGINDAIRTVMAQIATWITGAIFKTPNSGTTGGVRIAGNATSGNAILQFTDSASSTEWGYIISTAAKVLSFADGGGTVRAIGFRSLPTSRSVTASATVALADEGMVIKSTAGGLIVPNNATLAIPVDFLGAFYNNSGSAQTITGGTGVTFQIEGSASTQSSVSVPKYTRASFWQAAANNWVVGGKGVS